MTKIDRDDLYFKSNEQHIKNFGISNVESFSADEQAKFLSTFVIDIATTHKDQVNDVLTKNFINDTVQNLTNTYTSFFLNHDVGELPIGKVIDGKTLGLADGEFSAHLKVGISKSRPDIAMLVSEGILNKGSIGFFILSGGYEYNDDTDTLTIDKGNTIEGSLVGIPANNMAGVSDSSKSLRKSLITALVGEPTPPNEERSKSLDINNSEDINMKPEDIEAMIADKVKAVLDDRDAKAAALAETERIEQETLALAEREKSMAETEAAYVQKLADQAEEIARLKGGKQTSPSNGKQNKGTPSVDKYHFDNKDLALKKSIRHFDKLIKNAALQHENVTIVLEQSSDEDLFESEGY